MCEIWANVLLTKALKSCPKSNKSPNLVTLIVSRKGLGNFKYQQVGVHIKGILSCLS